MNRKQTPRDEIAEIYHEMVRDMWKAFGLAVIAVGAISVIYWDVFSMHVLPRSLLIVPIMFSTIAFLVTLNDIRRAWRKVKEMRSSLSRERSAFC